MTYSIIARDGATGQLGVAVQSHWFGVGAVVPWARAGVGAVATQANARIDYGPRGLSLMAGGMTTAEALASLLADDPAGDSRQVAMLDARGGVACWTGPDCMAFAGDIQADAVSCQANIMASEAVWPAMLAAFAGSGDPATESARSAPSARSASAPLARRLLAALVAAEAAGGDLRGRQSAALLVVPGAGEPWETVVSLRVEDDPEPLAELARLLDLHDAYEVAESADAAVALGDFDAAAAAYRRAYELAPESAELRFWAGLGLAHEGEDEAALVLIRAAIAEHAGWRELLARLSPELAPAAARLLGLLGGEPRHAPGS